jgi:hypothetical protein
MLKSLHSTLAVTDRFAQTYGQVKMFIADNIIFHVDNWNGIQGSVQVEKTKTCVLNVSRKEYQMSSIIFLNSSC